MPGPTSEKDLQFKPLSEGLGFHPFSNGLPYTPAVPKRDFSRGAGATAAGRPDFVFPVGPKPATAAPLLAAGRTPSLAQATAPTTTPNTGDTRLALGPALGWDYVGRRFFAFFIDSGFNILLGALVLIASLWPSNQMLGRIFNEVFGSSDLLLLTAGFLLFFNWALIAAQEVASGTTIGKRLMGLNLDGGPLALLVRALVFVPSVLFFGLGVLWCLFDQDRRGFHDWITGIQPEEN